MFFCTLLWLFFTFLSEFYSSISDFEVLWRSRGFCRVFYEATLKRSIILDASLARDATLVDFPGAGRFLKCKQSHSVLALEKVLLCRFCLPPVLNVCFLLMSFIQARVETSTLSEPIAGTENISENAAMELRVFSFPQNCRRFPFGLFSCSSLSHWGSLKSASIGSFLALALTSHCPPAPESQAIKWHLWKSQTYYQTASWF